MRHGLRAAVCSVLALAALAPIARAQDDTRPFERRPELTELVNRRLDIARSTVARLDLPADAPEQLTIAIPYEDTALTLHLERHSNRAENYRLLVQLADGSFIEHEPAPITTYRGTIEELPGAIAAATLSPDGIQAKVLMPEGFDSYIIEPLATLMDGADPLDHVLYNQADRDSNIAGVCGTTNDDLLDAIDLPTTTPDVARGSEDVFIAELACDADVEYFNSQGGSVANVEARINTIINTVNIQYERDVNITHVITAIVVRTAEPDPYTTNVPGDLVNQVVVEWVIGEYPEITRDVVHLFTGKNIQGSVIGIASGLSTICTIGAACLSQAEYNGNFGCATALVAHELGHLWSAAHCDCVNNTMNPFNTCENQFSQVSIDSIIAHRNTRPCLNFPEPAVTTFPFLDEFPGEALDPSKWTGIEGTPLVNGQAFNIPSGDTVLNISGSDRVRSALIPAELQDDLVLSYKTQRAGALDAPEPGDDLYVEYLSEQGQWIILEIIPGDGPAQSDFITSTFDLPDDAEYNGLRLRFRNASFDQDTDDFFIDDVQVTGTPILPADFALTLPADGAINVPNNPTFQWQLSQFAASYTLIVDNNADFSSPILNFTTGVPGFNNPGFNLADGVYHWRVSATNINGTVESLNGPSEFTVGEPVADVCLGDCTNNGVVDFDDLVRMLFQFGTNPGDGCDANDDNTVDFNDLVTTLFLFGACP